MTDSTCSNSCADGKFKNNTSNTCDNCDPKCLQCNSAVNTDCTVCSASNYLSSPSSCNPCKTGCALCIGGTYNDCSKCDSTFFL